MVRIRITSDAEVWGQEKDIETDIADLSLVPELYGEGEWHGVAGDPYQEYRTYHSGLYVTPLK
jgi:hypothetical protein